MDKGRGFGVDFRRFLPLLLVLLVLLIVQAVLPDAAWAEFVQVGAVIACWGVAIWWFWSWFKERMK